jgi:hypothetical protein
VIRNRFALAIQASVGSVRVDDTKQVSAKKLALTVQVSAISIKR